MLIDLNIPTKGQETRVKPPPPLMRTAYIKNLIMKKMKVIKIDSDKIEFEGGIKLYSYHWGDCCEEHYLDLTDLTLNDFHELEFDLTGDDFFERIKDYGIALKPINGHPVRIPGYSSNNGYYSSNLELVLEGHDFERRYDIEECQDWYQAQ